MCTSYIYVRYFFYFIHCINQIETKQHSLSVGHKPHKHSALYYAYGVFACVNKWFFVAAGAKRLVSAAILITLSANMAQLATAVARLCTIRAITRDMTALITIVTRHATSITAVTATITTAIASTATPTTGTARTLLRAVASQMARPATIVAARLIGRLTAVTSNMAGTLSNNRNKKEAV